jgi:mycothiol synthase
LITVDAERVNTRLPKGYRARPFRDSDREPLVEERNAWSHPMEEQSAEEWRMWERMAPDETQYRIVVEDDAGRVVGSANVGAGSMMRHPDGAQNGGVGIARADRRKGIGSALLEAVESVARSRGAPRFLSGASAAQPDSLAWASNRGYREIGRRIEAYLELATFEPARFADRVSKVRSSGIVMRTFADMLAGRDEEGRESFSRELFEAQGPMWEDVPFATRLEPMPYERFRKMSFESGQALYDLSLVAYDGDVIAGFTQSGRRQDKDAHTWMTGTARAYRGRGIATALKVEALSRAKAKGLRAMLTTNDEPNKAMRSINALLGYQALPAHVQLEKKLG